MPLSRRRLAVIAAGALAGALVAAGALTALRDDDPGRDAAGAGAVPSTGAPSSIASGPGAGPGAAGPPSSGIPSSAASPSATSAASSPSSAASAAPRSLLPRYPSPSTRLVPPTAVDATALGCERLPDGWRAEFTVTLDGGRGWTLLPQSGPVTSTDGRVWRVTVETPDAGAAPPTLALDRLLVGGGWPYDTVSVALPAGLVRTVTCALASGG